MRLMIKQRIPMVALLSVIAVAACAAPNRDHVSAAASSSGTPTVAASSTSQDGKVVGNELQGPIDIPLDHVGSYTWTGTTPVPFDGFPNAFGLSYKVVGADRSVVTGVKVTPMQVSGGFVPELTFDVTDSAALNNAQVEIESFQLNGESK